MKFQPSDYGLTPSAECFPEPICPDYGWSLSYPLPAMTVSGTAAKLGLSNAPANVTHEANLSAVSDFLARIPFRLSVTSGYRSPAVNAAVGGAKSSDHMEGLAADVKPPYGMSSRDLAIWAYLNRPYLPELDQVIYYTDTTHTHFSIGGRRRQEFLVGNKASGKYQSFRPSDADLADIMRRFPQKPASEGEVAAGSSSGVAAAYWTIAGVMAVGAILTAVWWRRRG